MGDQSKMQVNEQTYFCDPCIHEIPPRVDPGFLRRVFILYGRGLIEICLNFK